MNLTIKTLMNKFNRSNKVLNVSPNDILYAYKSRKTEIDSLRQYDRGEKTITPRSLRTTVRSV